MSVSHPTVLCFPHAGGGANVFRSWHTAFGNNANVLPICLPGRESLFLEPPLVTLPAMADWVLTRYAAALQPPLIFFGHSLGALLAYTVARRLMSPQLPQLLIVAGYRPPQLPRVAPELHRLSSTQFWQALHDYGGLNSAIFNAPELQRLVEPTVRADFQAVETYCHAANNEQLQCPILALAGRSDAFAPPAAMRDWQQLTSQQFTQIDCDGDHFFLDAARDTVLMAIKTMGILTAC
jgi:medium-chain acyl-[acyl-carrier-protein] hydrolase